MNKKIKSTKDIRRELIALFLNILDKNDLTKRVEKYVKGITGKELISEEKIKIMLMHRLDYFISEKGTKYYDKVSINKLLPFETFKKNYKKDSIEGLRKKFDGYNFTFCYNIIESFYAISKPDYKYDSMSEKDYLMELKKDSDLEELHNFLRKYATIERYFYYLIKDTKKRFLVSLIKNKRAPLSSIFHFFNINKDVRENIEYFYKLLNRKFSRHTIQLAIQRELKNIKAGKFKMSD